MRASTPLLPGLPHPSRFHLPPPPVCSSRPRPTALLPDHPLPGCPPSLPCLPDCPCLTSLECSWRLGPILAGVIVASVCAAFLYRRQTRPLEASNAAAQVGRQQRSARPLFLLWSPPLGGIPPARQPAQPAQPAIIHPPPPPPPPPQAALAEVASSSFTNMRTVRIFAGEALEQARFGAQVAQSYASGLGFARAKAMVEGEGAPCAAAVCCGCRGQGGGPRSRLGLRHERCCGVYCGLGFAGAKQR